MDELEVVGRLGRFAQDSERESGLQVLQESIRRLTGRLHQRRTSKARPQRRRRGQRLHDLGVDRLQHVPEHRANCRRCVGDGDLAEQAAAAARPAHLSSLEKVRHERLCQERVALAQRADRALKAWVRAPAEHVRRQLGQLGLSERWHRYLREHPLPRQGRQSLPRLDGWPVEIWRQPEEHEDREALDAGRCQRGEGRNELGPERVVDHDEARLARPFEQRERNGVPPARDVRRRQAVLDKPAQYLLDTRRIADPIHLETESWTTPGDLVKQAGLADTCLTGERRHDAVPTACHVRQPVDVLQELLATDERRFDRGARQSRETKPADVRVPRMQRPGVTAAFVERGRWAGHQQGPSCAAKTKTSRQFRVRSGVWPA